MISSDLLVSSGCMFLTCLLSKFTRNYFREQFPKGELIGIFAQEFIAMFEMCAICYESGVVIQYHGIGAFFAFLFAICLWRSFDWEDATASPCSYIEAYWFTGKFNIVSVFAIILSQLLGGALVYNYYTKFVWSFGLRDAHKGRYEEFMGLCKSDVQVFPFYAALIEGFSIFICSITWRIFSTLTNPTICNVVTSFVVSCLVVAALGISGGYLNPALASILQNGCKGATLVEQFLVYWVSSTIGIILASYFWNYVQRSPNLKPIIIGQNADEESKKLKRG